MGLKHVSPSGDRFDESIVPRTSPEYLDEELTRRFLREDAELTEDTLHKLRIVAADEEDVVRLTLAGVLLCTQQPQQWMPHAYIQAVSYAGERTDVNYQTDARDIEGPLDEQVAEALHFVRRNMLVRATKVTARVDQPQFSERAVFEALVNAVAHRDYSMGGRGCVCTCSETVLSYTSPVPWLIRSRQTVCTCGSPIAMNLSCLYWRVVRHRLVLDGLT